MITPPIWWRCWTGWRSARAHVAGLSLGGYVTLAVTRLAPERVDGLVLADTKAPADNTEQRASRDRLSTRRAGGPEAVAVEMLPRLVGQTTAREQPSWSRRLQIADCVNPVAGLRRAIRRLRESAGRHAWARGHHGPDARHRRRRGCVNSTGRQAEFLAQHIPGARLETVTGAGHLSTSNAQRRSPAC